MATSHLTGPTMMLKTCAERLRTAIDQDDWDLAEQQCRAIMAEAGRLYPRLSAISEYRSSAEAIAEVDRALKS